MVNSLRTSIIILLMDMSIQKLANNYGQTEYFLSNYLLLNEILENDLQNKYFMMSIKHEKKIVFF